MRRGRDERTPDLFDCVYPVRRMTEDGGTLASDAWLRHALSRALKECPSTREEVAAEMGRLTDNPNMSAAMLNNYTAESNQQHHISVIRFMAFVRATGAIWLLDAIAAPLGCTIMEGEEAQLAERGLIRQQIEELQRREKELARQKPVRIRRPL